MNPHLGSTVPQRTEIVIQSDLFMSISIIASPLYAKVNAWICEQQELLQSSSKISGIVTYRVNDSRVHSSQRDQSKAYMYVNT